MQEICQSFTIDANVLVNQWMAFSSSKKVELNLDTIEVFDREVCVGMLEFALTVNNHPPFQSTVCDIRNN